MTTGQIESITIGRYKQTDALEANVIFLIDGQEIRRRWKSPHASRRATEQWAREKGRVFLAHHKAAKQPVIPTFGEFASQFAEDHIAANRLAPSTAANLRASLRDHLLPMFGSKQLGEINDDDVTALKKRKIEESGRGIGACPEGTPLATGTINKLLQNLGMIMRAAVRKYKIPPLTIKRVREADKRHDFYPIPEYAALVAAAATHPKTLALVLLAGDAGLRRGEIIALDWRRVDFAANKIHVECADWKGIIGPPKGKRPRSVPMTSRLRAALLALEREGERVLTRDDAERSDRPHTRGEPVTVSVLGHWLRSAQKRAGVKISGPHILRHTFCSHLAMGGAPVTAIRDLAGHASITVTNRYMHLAPSGVDDAMALLERVRTPTEARAVVDFLLARERRQKAGASNQETVRRREGARPKKSK